MGIDKKIKIAIAGLGAWAQYMHLKVCEILQNDNLIDIVAICDKDINLLEKYSKLLVSTPFSDFDKMIQECNIDGIVLLFPAEINYLFAEKLANKGIPFLIEKPPANSLEKHVELMNLLGNHRHVVAYNRRFSPFAQRAKRWLNGDKINSIEAIFTRNCRYDKDFTTTLIHAIDFVLYTANSDIQEFSVRKQMDNGITNYFINIITKNLCNIHLSVLPDAGYDIEKYYIHCKNKSIEIEHPFNEEDYGCAKLFERGKSIEIVDSKNFDLNELFFLNGVYHEHLHFLEIIKLNTMSISSFVNTMDAQKVRDEILTTIT